VHAMKSFSTTLVIFVLSSEPGGFLFVPSAHNNASSPFSQVSGEIRLEHGVQHQTAVGKLLHQGQDRGLQSVPYHTRELAPVGQLRPVLQSAVVQDRHGVQTTRLHDRTVPGTVDLSDVQEPGEVRALQ